jgi:hypothetical protein
MGEERKEPGEDTKEYPEKCEHKYTSVRSWRSIMVCVSGSRNQRSKHTITIQCLKFCGVGIRV